MNNEKELRNPSNSTNIPILFSSLTDCCGCTACYSACPKHAISMVENEEGFLYPHINEELCVGCHLCEKVCAFKRDVENRNNANSAGSIEPLHTYAVRHKSEEVRKKSRSGGIFTAASDYAFDNGGVVYGCALDEHFMAHHIRATSSEDRDKMRGSKYIQSALNDTFERIKTDLDNDLMVLFSGTSCQVAGLKAFLKKDYSNLICMDIVCHGVPSPLVWRKYLDWQEERNHGKVVAVDFRSKREYGWRAPIETLYLQNWYKAKVAGSHRNAEPVTSGEDELSAGSHRNAVFARSGSMERQTTKKIRLINDVLSRPAPKNFECIDERTDTIVYSDVFTNLFYDHGILRPSCYQCPYKSLSHPGDITIGDYWGINKVSAAHLDDDKGVSLVMVNTSSGQEIFEAVRENIIAEETGISEPMMQQPLREAFPCPDNREQFWNDFQQLPFAKISRKYAKHSYYENIRFWLGCKKRTLLGKIKK